MTEARMAPDAVVCLDRSKLEPDASGPTLCFFKNSQYLAWDVVNETMLPGYPRDIARDWPGLLEAAPSQRLRGALYVPAWGDRIHFFFEGASRIAAWDLQRRALDPGMLGTQAVLPGALTREDFTPVYAQLADGTPVVYGFRGFEYTRWSVGRTYPAHEDAGYPRRIDADWKDGLVLAPRAGVYVDWPSRSSAHSNRKLYFFMGDLYLRWDVPSNTRNYRLDIVAGWKGWPAFA